MGGGVIQTIALNLTRLPVTNDRCQLAVGVVMATHRGLVVPVQGLGE